MFASSASGKPWFESLNLAPWLRGPGGEASGDFDVKTFRGVGGLEIFGDPGVETSSHLV